jgi:CrcB protein
MTPFTSYVWVALGSIIGGMGRFFVSGVVANWTGGTFPWNTMIVNVTGSFIIGIFGALATAEGKLSPKSQEFVAKFLMTGICGGYTTFSSFSWNTLNLVQRGQWLYAFGNMAGSVGFCMIAVWLGYLTGSAITK